MPSFMGMSGDQIAVFIRSVFDGKGFQELEKAFKKAGQEAKKAGEETQSFWDKTAFNIPGLGKDGGNLAITWGKVAIAAGGAAAAIGTAAVATRKYYQISEEGAQKRQLEESFFRIVQGAGMSATAIDEMTSSVQNTIPDLGVMSGVMTLIAGMTPRVTKEFLDNSGAILEVAKAANKLNPTLGDTDFMFRSLATGIKRSEVRLIDNLGIRVKVDDANRRYAEQIGKNVSALNAEERQLALLYETLRAGRELIQQVGGDVASQTDQFLAMAAAVQNFRNELSMFLGTKEFFGITSVSQVLGEMTDEMEKQRVVQEAIDAGVLSEAQARGAWLKAQESSAAEMRDYIELVKRSNEQEEWLYKNRLRRGVKPTQGPAGDADMAMLMLWANWEPQQPPSWGISGQTSFSGYDDYKAMLAQRRLEVIRKKVEEADERTKDFNESYAELNEEVARHNLEVAAEYLKAYHEAIMETGDSMRKIATDDGSLFTKSIDEIGDSWIRVGGSTTEQKELLEDYQKAAEGAKDELRDWETGLKGFGMEQDKINEKIAAAAAEYDYFQQKIDSLKIEQGELQRVHQSAVWDLDKVKQALLDANEEAGASADLWAGLKQVLGDWTLEQAFDAQKAGALQNFIKGVAEDSMTAEEQWAKIVEHMKFLDTLKPADFVKDYTPLLPEGMTYDEMNQQFAKDFREATGQEPVLIPTQLEAIDEQRSKDHAALWESIWGWDVTEPEEKPMAIVADPDALNNWNILMDQVTATEKKYIQIVELPARSEDKGIPQTPSVPPAAAGRRAFADQPYIVGEHGREVFIPGIDGMITQLDRISGGSTYNFYISNPDANKVKRAVVDYLRYTESR